eukprot:TRINITY_DN76908_c0_g1_i1.p1 TRINITY_DN76908_c0_g1~~TRINITY_DN76908_c0_g1_i1.p1  ORF type:complete len:342 (-),score=42.31 TRINITY_DN76908_c0_g1_i1:68-1069(-)
MGNAPPCKEHLVRPADKFRLDEATEKELLTEFTESILKEAVGSFSWKMSAWDSLSQQIDAQQEKFIMHLRNRLQPESASVEVSEVRLIHLKGKSCPPGTEPQTSGWMPDLTSRTWKFVDAQGDTFGATSSVNTESRMGPMPPRPSFQELGIDEAFQQLCSTAKESGNAYVTKITHFYSVTQYHPPQGPFKWECEVVLLKVSLQSVRTVVLQISVDETDAEDVPRITASNLAGETVASVKLRLDHDNVDSLLELLAEATHQDRKRIQLLFESGEVADIKQASRTLGSFLRTPHRQPGTDNCGSHQSSEQHGEACDAVPSQDESANKGESSCSIS